MKLDPMHIRFAYSLAGATQLPVTGDNHPLSREAHRWLIWASSVTMLLGFCLFLGWQRLEARGSAVGLLPADGLQRRIVVGVPPSVAQSAPPRTAEDFTPIQPRIAYPDPVPDDQAPDTEFLSRDEISRALDDAVRFDFEKGLAVAPDLPAPVAPADPVREAAGPVNQLPVRLSMDRPHYPDLARMARIEGTVLLNVLVDTDGRVAKVEVVSGPAQLRQAAIAAAKTAVFKPATMDRRPVQVWVAMPVGFRLHAGG
jgi:TonB family protein